MTKKRIIVVLGTRPEAIKLAPVVLALRRQRSLLCKVWSTGQHRQMLAPAFDAFGIRPDVDLDLMRAGEGPGCFVARAFQALDRRLYAAVPDLVLAQGDTGTVLAAALAAFFRRIPFGHVEAGLRTGDLSAPWPEEANRVLVSRVATLHFAPTAQARGNLLREGVQARRIYVTGNTVVDALHDILRRRTPASREARRFLRDTLPRPFVLITAHRRENQGSRLRNVLDALGDIARLRPDVDLVFPVHLNPAVKAAVEGAFPVRPPNLWLVSPLDYATFVRLMARSALILTDSGGIQEEAPSLGKRVLVLRDRTERPEGLRLGLIRLIGTDRARVASEVCRALAAKTPRSLRTNPYGDGRAAERIVCACLRFLNSSPAWPS